MRLARRREEARREQDFAAADELRAAIAAAGWEVTDSPDGFVLRPGPPVVSVLADLENPPEDGRRLTESLARRPPPGGRVEVIPVPEGPGGFAAGRNAALEVAQGPVVMFVDTSLEVVGDLCSALLAALEDPTVAVAGPYGLASADLYEYEERTDGEVVAVQGYCLAARQADLAAVGGFRESFVFYRNADIDLSLRLRTAGPELRRAVAVGEAHCRRHVHRAWEATDPLERERLSRRNLRRVLDRFGNRAGELVVP